jgi:hypothetical protein
VLDRIIHADSYIPFQRCVARRRYVWIGFALAYFLPRSFSFFSHPVFIFPTPFLCLSLPLSFLENCSRWAPYLGPPPTSSVIFFFFRRPSSKSDTQRMYRHLSNT